ncbi:MAG: hypothetical protein AVDCRST_MAG53-1437, partial [uncultured Solirubrobacteraceae bacterium]
ERSRAPPAQRSAPRRHGRRRPPAHGGLDAALRAAAAQPDRPADRAPSRGSPRAAARRARDRPADPPGLLGRGARHRRPAGHEAAARRRRRRL